MLKSAFIGNLTHFDLMLCHWLDLRTKLTLCFWTSKLSWTYRDDRNSVQIINRIAKHFRQRTKKYGIIKILNEIMYFAYYHTFIINKDQSKVEKIAKNYWSDANISQKEFREGLFNKEVFIEDIKSDNLPLLMRSNGIDIAFAMCVDVIFPEKLFSTPRLGTYLWHEGITPEYKGVHSPFWALYNKEFDKLGYTFLKIGKKIDAGKIYVQGRVNDINPLKDYPSYIGHKAIYDSLPQVERFLFELENADAQEIIRSKAHSNFYTYPGFTQLASILWYRLICRLKKELSLRPV